MDGQWPWWQKHKEGQGWDPQVEWWQLHLKHLQMDGHLPPWWKGKESLEHHQCPQLVPFSMVFSTLCTNAAAQPKDTSNMGGAISSYGDLAPTSAFMVVATTTDDASVEDVQFDDGSMVIQYQSFIWISHRVNFQSQKTSFQCPKWILPGALLLLKMFNLMMALWSSSTKVLSGYLTQ